jgi:hypothetical protein
MVGCLTCTRPTVKKLLGKFPGKLVCAAATTLGFSAWLSRPPPKLPSRLRATSTRRKVATGGKTTTLGTGLTGCNGEVDKRLSPPISGKIDVMQELD